MVLLPILAVAFAVRSCQGDPNNGYNDYLRAVALLDDETSVALEWSPQQYTNLQNMKDTMSRGSAEKGAEPWTDSLERQLRFAREIHDLDYLGVQRVLAKRFESAKIAVRTGNQKPCWDPRSSRDVLTLFPEYAKFKMIAKLFAADAYVHFADGDSAVAVADLLDCITFARQVGGNNLIDELVSIACRAIALGSFDQHLDRLSHADVTAVQRFADKEIALPPSYAKALAGERDSALASLDLLFKSPGDLVDGTESAPPGADDFLAHLSPRDRESAKAVLRRGLVDVYSKVISFCNQDESTWSTFKDEDFLPPMPSAVKTIQDLSDVLVHTFSPIFEQAAVSELRSRTQLRLLSLHARVIGFRWEHGRLPKDLQECAPDNIIHDPMSNGDFQFSAGAGDYRLFSKGVASTGPIELRYRRPKNLGDGDGIPPQ